MVRFAIGAWFVLSLVCMAACELVEKNDYPFDYPGDRIVVNGILEPTFVAIRVSKSQNPNFPTDISGNSVILHEASIALKDSAGQVIAHIPYLADGVFFATMTDTLPLNTRMSIVVQAAGLPEAVVENLMIPEFSAQVSADFKGLVQEGPFEGLLAIDLILEDSDTKADYYTIHQYNLLAREVTFDLFRMDETLRQQCGIYSYYDPVLSDRCFNGTSIQLPLLAQLEEAAYQRDSFDMFVASTDKAFFDYLISLRGPALVLDDIFGRPNLLYSNVVGGYGIVIPRNARRFRFPVN